MSDGFSIHTRRWVSALVKRGIIIHLFSLKDFNESDYPHENFTYTVVDCQKRSAGWGGFGKIAYLKALPELKKQICKFVPDIVHAHFASSYGLLGALSGFHPLIVSVWGSDVFDFPYKSFLHRKVFEFTLRKADKILSTSNVMAVEAGKFTDKDIEITPFGIDLNDFSMNHGIKIRNNLKINEQDIVVGTIKLLEPKYGIEFLIKAFAQISEKHPAMPLKLVVAGDGSEKNKLYDITAFLKIENKVVFTGMIDHASVPDYINSFNIFAALSIEESFGVAVVEAQACGVPVVVSDAGGLPEVVEDGVTGSIVPKKNVSAAADAIEKLVLDKDLREKMGKAGRNRVERLYNWNQNVDKMISIYNITLKDLTRDRNE